MGLSLAPSSNILTLDHRTHVAFPKVLSLAAVSELAFNIAPPQLDLAKSPANWSLNLKSLSLFKSFEGFIADLFGADNKIYFTSIAWDYSGSTPFVYPPKGATASDFVIPMQAKTKREFIGAGVNLWPSQVVVGALNLVIFVYENDQDVRELGNQLVNIHDQVANSKLATLIGAIAVDPALATGVAIGTAVNELIGVVGNIMKTNGDDYVDLFEGSYGTDRPQTSRVETYNQEAAGIVLDFNVSPAPTTPHP